MTFDAYVPEAVRGEPRLEHVAGPGGDDPVALAERQRLREDGQVDVEVRGRQVPVGTEPFPVRQGQPAACRPWSCQPYPAVDVLPEVHHEGRCLAQGPDRDRLDLLDPPDGRRDGPDDGDADVARDGGTPRPVVED